MNQITREGRLFLKNGSPHFFLLDTAWMAFSNPTVEEFEEYVSFRSQQGFNALLIMNTPAFSDMSDHVRWFPFEICQDGSFDFGQINTQYFEVAKAKLEIMQKYDMTPLIVLVWGCYMKGSSLESCYDCEGKQFTQQQEYERFVDASIHAYQKYHPVWMIGGDVNLEGEALKKYLYMAGKVRDTCGEDLMGLHVSAGTYIPEVFFRNHWIDFYSYQSGHLYQSEEDDIRPAVMAGRYRGMKPELPVMNLEPMYEAHGFGNKFGRFGAFHIRRAFWYSVLSGANAGFAYGAHGVWIFFEKNALFNNENWSKWPLEWRSALQLPGSYDIAYQKEIYLRYNMFRLKPCPERNLTPYGEIRVASDEDEAIWAVYTPYTNYVILDVDLSRYDCRWYLSEASGGIVTPVIRYTSGRMAADRFEEASRGQKNPVRPRQELRDAHLVSFVEMYPYNCDGLLVCTRKEDRD